MYDYVCVGLRECTTTGTYDYEYLRLGVRTTSMYDRAGTTEYVRLRVCTTTSTYESSMCGYEYPQLRVRMTRCTFKYEYD